LAYKIVQVEPVPPKVLNIHIPQVIENICKKALAKDPLPLSNPYEVGRHPGLSGAAVSSNSGRSTIITKGLFPLKKPEIIGKTQVAPGKGEAK
jgi:hypothetical protein